MLKKLKKSDIINQQLIEDNRNNHLRCGEGCVVPLKDNTLLMVYGHFNGTEDHDQAMLLERRSDDGGITWFGSKIFLEPLAGAINVMSASLLRLSDGRIGALYLDKYSAADDCRPMWITSGDEGKTWSKPVTIAKQVGYYVVNNDRLVQLSSGRIIVPFGRAVDWPGMQACGCFISDDLGETWNTGNTIMIKPENILRPKQIDTSNKQATKIFETGQVYAQEPGAVELLDGRVYMWARSTGGYAYSAISNDGGQSWSGFKAIAEFAMPSGPQSIKRLPGSKRLIMLYNDRGQMPFGAPQFQWRRPLSIAISDDDTKTWQRYGQLEPDDIVTNCYFSICFHNENVIFTYYEGVMKTREDGTFAPQNLASLKLKIVKQSYFDK